MDDIDPRITYLIQSYELAKTFCSSCFADKTSCQCGNKTFCDGARNRQKKLFDVLNMGFSITKNPKRKIDLFRNFEFTLEHNSKPVEIDYINIENMRILCVDKHIFSQVFLDQCFEKSLRMFNIKYEFVDYSKAQINDGMFDTCDVDLQNWWFIKLIKGEK